MRLKLMEVKKSLGSAIFLLGSAVKKFKSIFEPLGPIGAEGFQQPIIVFYYLSDFYYLHITNVIV